MMKKLALISSYCDTAEKIEVLVNNLNILKYLGVDVLLLSPIDLPTHVIQLCDYYFQTKENPVLHWPVKAITTWADFEHNGLQFRLNKVMPDHGWAGLYQTKILSLLGIMLNYDKYYHIIYDLVIDDNVIGQLIDTVQTKTIYPTTDNNIIWDSALHFMIFDKKNLGIFESYINLDDYLKNTHIDAFGWLYYLRSKFNYEIGSFVVRDSIHLSTNDVFQYYDYSPVDGVRFFIEKNTESFANVRLLIYYMDSNRITSILCNEKEIRLFEPFDLGFASNNIKETIIKINELDYNITEIIEKIEHNTLFIYESNFP